MNWKHWLCWLLLCLIPLAGNAVTPMITGSFRSLFLASDGSTWTVGSNGATSPVQLFPFSDVTVIANDCNSAFLAVRADGTVWGYGNNVYGQLGDGTTESRSQPQKVPGLIGVKAVSASGYHVLALKNDGTVMSWGANEVGQLGDGTRINRRSPVPVVGLTSITRIEAQWNSSLALKADGTVWKWGWAVNGLLGDGTSVWTEIDPAQTTPKLIPELDQVIDIAVGRGHHLALRKDGTVWAWGYTLTGALGINEGNSSANKPTRVSGIDQVIAIKAGIDFSMALKSDGTVWMWGNNNIGQLGITGVQSTHTPTQVLGLTDVTAISAGYNFAMAMKRDGSVYAWGDNSDAQLGDGTVQSRAQPRLVLAPGGTGSLNLMQAGPSTYNQLPTAIIQLTPQRGAAPLEVKASAMNANDSDGSIKTLTWSTNDGQNAVGQSATFLFRQLGKYRITLLIEDNAGGRGYVWQEINVAPPTVTNLVTAPKAKSALLIGLALSKVGRIYSWGSDSFLGLYKDRPTGSSRYYPVPIETGITGAIEIAPGTNNSFALLADGTVLSWGGNANGEAGIADSTIAFVYSPQAVKGLPPILSIGYIEMGTHTLALSKDGRVFSWGQNDYGQLGLGDYANRYAATEINGLTNVVAVAMADVGSFALKSDGTVWAWGFNFGYQFADGTGGNTNRPKMVAGLSNIRKIFGTYSNLFAQEADGTTWVIGSLPFKRAGDSGNSWPPRHLQEFDGAKRIEGGGSHLIVLKADGTVWTGGQFSTWALGYAGTGDSMGLRQVPGITNSIDVSASGFLLCGSSLVTLSDGTVLAWGCNYYTQLGDGTLANRLTPVQVVNETNDGPLDLIPDVANGIFQDKIPAFYVQVSKADTVSSSIKYRNEDLNQRGWAYVVAYLDPNSPLLTSNTPNGLRHRSITTKGGSPLVAAMLTRTGFKQMASNAPTEALYSGSLTADNSTFTLYDTIKFDQTKDNGIFCTGYAVPGTSGSVKGMIRSIVTGADATLNDCPPLQVGTTVDTQAPTTPLNVSATAAGPGQVNLSWTPATDNIGVAHYNIYRDGTLITTLGDATSYSDIDPQASTNYSYSVMACDLALNCSGQSTNAPVTTPAQSSFTLNPGWNLVGNGGSTAMDVASMFNDSSKVGSLWKWVTSGSNTGLNYPTWAFYTPALTDGGANLAASKGYEVLSSIQSGEGFWVNAKTAHSVPMTAPAWIVSTVFQQNQSNALPIGWSLIATGDNPTPSAFNQVQGSASLTSLWAWNNLLSKWYFYAPNMEASGSLADYVRQKNYLDFGALTLTPTTGFWVNKP